MKDVILVATAMVVVTRFRGARIVADDRWHPIVEEVSEAPTTTVSASGPLVGAAETSLAHGRLLAAERGGASAAP